MKYIHFSMIGRYVAALGSAAVIAACSSGTPAVPTPQGPASFGGPAGGAVRGRAMTVIGHGFVFPRDVAVDKDGNVFVTDGGNGALKKVSPNGAITTIASGLKLPFGVSVDAHDDVYVACAAARLSPVRMYTPKGKLVTIGSGFYIPEGVFVDASGVANAPSVIYVADTGNNLAKKIVNGQITRIGPVFNSPGGIAADAAHNVYISNTSSNAVVKVALDGTVTKVGHGFNHPYGLAVDRAGNLYVADTSNNAIKKVEPNGTIVTLGSGFSGPYGVAVDASGNVYVADTYHNRIVRFKP